MIERVMSDGDGMVMSDADGAVSHDPRGGVCSWLHPGRLMSYDPVSALPIRDDSLSVMAQAGGMPWVMAQSQMTRSESTQSVIRVNAISDPGQRNQ